MIKPCGLRGVKKTRGGFTLGVNERRIMRTLSSTRAALYAYTRPAFAVFGAGACAYADTYISPLPHPALSSSERIAAALPLVAVGGAGVVAAASRHGGFAWLSYAWERQAWIIGFSSLTASGSMAMVGHDACDAWLAPAAAAALAATAGERLGSTVGRILVPGLTCIGVLSALAATNVSRGFMTKSPAAPSPNDGTSFASTRASNALQVSALLMLPALQAVCLPVYSNRREAFLGLAWFWVAAAFGRLDPMTAADSLPAGLSTEAVKQVLISAGAASLLRTLVARRPICQF